MVSGAAEQDALVLCIFVCQLHRFCEGPMEHTRGCNGSTYVVQSGLWPPVRL